MVNHTLANLILDDEGFLAEHPTMVVRVQDGHASFDDQNGVLRMSGDVDFTTYLNALSVGKWRQYAGLEAFFLHLELRGAPCEVHATSLAPGMRQPLRDHRPLATVGESDAWQEVDLVVPVPEGSAIVSFAVVAHDEVELRAGQWYTQVNDDDVRDVRLAVATTTFRKEAYVTRNIEAIRAHIFNSEYDAADDFKLFVVDNGRTLDAEELSDGHVVVLPNPNVGGSGGFARGMMAAIDAGCTHVLLMDDDVRVLPESLKRTYNLLRLARGRYESAFVEGAMLNMEDPNLLFEDVATVKRDGMYGRIKEDLLVDSVEGILQNELVDVERPLAYGAWWYCCIPCDMIRRKGLPLPLFVRCDDVEYGMRCQPTIMTMGGICVWHERFEGRFRASVDSYQLTRNFLVMASCDSLDAGIVRAFMLRFSRTFGIYLRAMNYDTCELMLDGLADYLKGPAFLAEASGEQILMSNGKKNEKLEDVELLDDELRARTVPDPRYLGQGKDRGMFLKLVEMIPHDRHLLPDLLLSDDPAPVYYSRGAYPARRTMRRKTLVAYDQSATMAHVRTMDRARWHRLRQRYGVLLREYRRHGDEIAQEYRQALPSLTSREFWEDYLQRQS